MHKPATKIPRSPTNNNAPEAIVQRQQFVKDELGVSLDHVGHFSQPTEALHGNIENPIGVAQVPIGLAGPF